MGDASGFGKLFERLASREEPTGFARFAARLPLPDTAPASARRHLALAPSSTRPLRNLEIAARYAALRFTFEPSPTDPAVDWLSYDHYLVGFSGGKDSLALVLLLLLLGAPKDRIELWHHEVDGGAGELLGGGTSTLMDWPCTRAYCRAVADALGVKLYRSWKIGGFEREMTKSQAATAGYVFEVPGGGFESAGGKSKKLGTRMMFPQMAASLSVRWCSAYLKIMVMDAAIRNQDRFLGKQTLVLTGERGEESAGRATYEIFEPNRADLRGGQIPRLVDHGRPIRTWPEAAVWKLIERFRINPHPAYHLGWGRVSCAPCIFGSPDQWASLRAVNPAQFRGIARYEHLFDKTIDRHLTVEEKADKGTPFPGMRARDIRAALSRTYDEPIFVDPWTLPRGALLGDASGPI